MPHPTPRRPGWLLVLLAPLVAALPSCAPLRAEGDGAGPGPAVSFRPPADRVEVYDFAEVTAQVRQPGEGNPFTQVSVRGRFQREGDEPVTVDGFCDADDGTLFRVRYMPARPGRYQYSVTYERAGQRETHEGSFEAVSGKRRGVLRVDRDHPWHFVWEGTGEHYFFNGTTAFLLMGWEDEAVIRACLDRFQRYQVNRVRVLLNGRPGYSLWGEPIVPGAGFQLAVNPWPAQRGDDLCYPGFDYSRFRVAHWQRFERMLRHARDKDIVISVVLDWGDSPEHPAAGGEDERRYYRYAAARLGPFANVTWDLGDDVSRFRTLAWSHEMGTFLHSCDVYHHLATDHPIDNKHQDRAAEWFGFTSFQEWSRPQHAWMLGQRETQKRTGRIIPQANEEYGYEDHYPRWAQNYPDGASAEGLRRTAWEIYMAGCYQTTGETARRGTGYWPDTGGGWVNGRGDDTMVLLRGYAHIVEFFTGFAWWTTEPHDDLVNGGAWCLADPGRVYAVYLPMGRTVHVRLLPGKYEARWLNPRTGKVDALPAVEQGGADAAPWAAPEPPDHGDWALLLTKG
jgi:Protein of unknown function (DUF4038)/Domain of unknown function (DUF5060)/Putative collagen-binding domain of a collagenase